MAETLSALVVSTGNAEALRATLGALATSPTRTWCAVSTPDEAAAAVGLANVRMLEPWPGSRAALAQLAAAANLHLTNDAVILLTAGTMPQRNFLPNAMAQIRSGAAVVMGTDRRAPTDGWSLLGRLTSSALAHAVLPPTSGLVMRAETLTRLTDAGWLEGTEIRLAEIRRFAGPVRVLRDGISSYRSHRVDAFGVSRRPTVTVLIPAHNEEAWIGETLRSMRTQTLQPDEVIVVDDCSSDRTAEIAAHHGATVLRTPTNRLKAGAQNYGLERIRTETVVTLDADTVLHPEAIDYLIADLEAGFDATNGVVMPQSRSGIWTRSRLVEYAMAMRVQKRVQLHLGSILVLSGCVAAFHTRVLRELGGFKERTLTEDLDLTWEMHVAGYRVGYTTGAVSYPAEPDSWRLYKAQLRRWAAGLFQTISVQGGLLRRKRSLVFILAAAMWDMLTGWILLTFTLFVVATRGFHPSLPVLLISMTITVFAPILIAASVIGFGAAIACYPAYFLASFANQYFYLEAMFREWVLRRRGTVWVKGH